MYHYVERMSRQDKIEGFIYGVAMARIVEDAGYEAGDQSATFHVEKFSLHEATCDHCNPLVYDYVSRLLDTNRVVQAVAEVRHAMENEGRLSFHIKIDHFINHYVNEHEKVPVHPLVEFVISEDMGDLIVERGQERVLEDWGIAAMRGTLHPPSLNIIAEEFDPDWSKTPQDFSRPEFQEACQKVARALSGMVYDSVNADASPSWNGPNAVDGP